MKSLNPLRHKDRKPPVGQMRARSTLLLSALLELQEVHCKKKIFNKRVPFTLRSLHSEASARVKGTLC